MGQAAKPGFVSSGKIVLQIGNSIDNL
jgi:hypothetical protein